MATVYEALGAKVTVVELLDQLIPGCDTDLVRVLQKRISSRYEAIKLGTRVTELPSVSRAVSIASTVCRISRSGIEPKADTPSKSSPIFIASPAGARSGSPDALPPPARSSGSAHRTRCRRLPPPWGGRNARGSIMNSGMHWCARSAATQESGNSRSVASTMSSIPLMP